MAQFNYSTETSNADYTGVSKGFTSKLAGVADLFKNVGDLSMAAVNIVDQNNLENQKTIIEAGVDKTLQDFGFRTAANDTTGTPPELQDYSNQLEKTHKAYLSGALKESNFQMRIDALSRRVRAMYPGYNDEIDTVISKTLNRSTANDLRKTLNAEWDVEANNASDDDKKFASDVSNARQDGVLPPGYDKDPNKWTKSSLRAYIADQYYEQKKVIRDRAALEDQVKQGTITHNKLVDSAYSAVSAQGRTILNTALSDTSLADIATRLASSTAKDMSPEEMSNIVQKYAALELKARTAYESILRDPVFDRLTADEKKNAIESGMTTLNAIKQAITDKDVGLLNVAASVNKMNTDEAISRYFNSNEGGADVLKRIQALKAILPPDIMNEYLLKNPDMLKDIPNALALAGKSDILAGKPLKKVMEDTTKAAGSEAKSSVTAQMASDTIKMATDPRMPEDQSMKLIESFFGEGNADFIKNFSSVPGKNGRSDQEVMFEKLASPAMTAKVAQLAKSDPSVLGKYKDFLQQSFTAMFEKDAKTVDMTNAASAEFEYRFNPKTSQFETLYKGKPLGVFGAAGYAAAGTNPFSVGAVFGTKLWDTYKNSNAKASVDRMNRYLTLLKPAMEASGDNTDLAITELMSSLGATDSAAGSNTWSKMLKAVLTTGQEKPGDIKALGGSREKSTSIFDEPADQRKVLRDFIGKAEGADYNTLNGGSSNIPLSNMSIGSVMEIAGMNRARNPDKLSTAVGKYQIIDETLRRAMKGVGLTEDDLFSVENQDKLANWLIDNEAGGGKDPVALSKVWASLPKADGKSQYEGDKLGNHATVSYSDLLKAIGTSPDSFR